MKHRIYFCLILLAGVVLRLYYAWTAPYVHSNCDNVTILLMARHIVNGEFPMFFYGQYYLGPLEPLAIALFFKICGIGEKTYFLGTILFSALFISSAYFLAKELKDKTMGLIVMLFCAIPPTYFFLEGVSPLGYHVEILFVGNMLLFLALRIPTVSNNLRKTILFIILGAVAGLGVWMHYLILYYLVPVAVYLLFNEKWKTLFKNSIPAIISFFVSALPFWIFTFKYNFATFKFKPKGTSTAEIREFLHCLKGHIFHILNIKPEHFGWIVLLFYIIITIYFVIKTVFKKRFLFMKNSIFVELFVFIFILYFGYKSKRHIGEGYNYLIPIMTFISVAFGYMISDILRKFRPAGVIICSAVIGFNTWNIIGYIDASKGVSLANKNMIFDRIDFLKKNGIYRYVGSEREGRVPVFFSNEKIIATAYVAAEYYPYQDIVEAADKVGFDECRDLRDWCSAIKHTCAGYDFERGMYFNFKPFPYEARMIMPNKWKAAVSEKGNNPYFAFDRNMDRIWASALPKQSGMDYVIDLGRMDKICKIIIWNGHHYVNYPNACRILSSTDGRKWNECVSVENVQPFFWSGPRPYWHLIDGRVEIFFKPVEARFIKIVQEGESADPWQMNEVFVYEYLGEKKFGKDLYLKDAESIKEFLFENNIDFIYADFWLSAKMRELTKEKIKAVVCHTSFLPPRENMSRDILFGRDRAFVIANEDVPGIEAVFNEFWVPFEKKEFINYVCYYFPELPADYKSIRFLVWIGNAIVKHDLRECSKWYYNMAREAEAEGDKKAVIEYCKKAVKYCPNNLMAVKALGNHNIQKYAKIYKNRFLPQKLSAVNFKNGVKFNGYTLKQSGGLYFMEYYWELKSDLKTEPYVFVYFMKDDKIIFQDDHKLLARYGRPLVPFPGEVFKEKQILKIPRNIRPGQYDIVLGLWDKESGKRIKIIDQHDKNKSKEVIGKVNIAN